MTVNYGQRYSDGVQIGHAVGVDFREGTREIEDAARLTTEQILRNNPVINSPVMNGDVRVYGDMDVGRIVANSLSVGIITVESPNLWVSDENGMSVMLEEYVRRLIAEFINSTSYDPDGLGEENKLLEEENAELRSRLDRLEEVVNSLVGPSLERLVIG